MKCHAITLIRLPKILRIFFYLSLSVIGFSLDSFAQQDKIDSLDEVLMQNNLNDSIRINSLNKLATLSGRYNKKRGYLLYNQSISLACRFKIFF